MAFSEEELGKGNVYFNYLDDVDNPPKSSTPLEDLLDTMCLWGSQKPFALKEIPLISKFFMALTNLESIDRSLAAKLFKVLSEILTEREYLTYQSSSKQGLRTFLSLINQKNIRSPVCNAWSCSLSLFPDNYHESIFNHLFQEVKNDKKMYAEKNYLYCLIQCVLEFKNPMLYNTFFEYLLDQVSLTYSLYLQPLIDLVIAKGADEEITRVLDRFIELIKTHGHDRAIQKNIGASVAKLYNRASKPMYLHRIRTLNQEKNIYARQAYIEILEKINIDINSKKGLLVQVLKVDPEDEVRRFAKIALRDLHSKSVKKESAFSPTSRQKPLKYLSSNSSIRTGQISRVKCELGRFQNSAIKTNRREKLIQGLTSSNNLISSYCFEMLFDNDYFEKKSHPQRIQRGINLLFSKATETNFSLSDESLNSYIYKLKRLFPSLEHFLNKKILNHIAACIRLNYRIIARDWINLIDFNNSSSEQVSNVIKKCIQFLQNNDIYLDVKENLLCVIYRLFFNKEYSQHVLNIIIKASNGMFGKELRFFATELLYECINALDDPIDINESIISLLNDIELSCDNIRLFEITICFLVSRVAKNGNSNDSKTVLTILSQILRKTGNTYLHFYAIDKIHGYGVDQLKALEPYLIRIQKCLSQKKSWHAYRQKDIQFFQRRLQQLNNYETDLSHYELIVFYIELLVEKNRLYEAEKAFNCYQEILDNLNYNYYLIAKIKFRGGNYGEAIGFCYNPIFKACNNNSRDISLHLLLYSCYTCRGDFHGAKEVYENILMLSPMIDSDYLDLPTPLMLSTDYIPYQKTIQNLYKQIEKIIKETVRDLNPHNREQKIRTSYDVFIKLVKNHFGSTVDSVLKEVPLNLASVINYPHQFQQVIFDIYFAVLRRFMHKFYIQHQSAYQQQLESISDLEKYIIESNICEYMTEVVGDRLDFLKTRSNVFSAKDFVKEFLFSGKLKGAYALGLSSDVSSAYNLLIGLFELVHYQVAYQELGVEPSGDTTDTNIFMGNIISKDLVVFVPRILKTTEKDNPTLDEIKFIIKFLINCKEKCSNVYLVFGAYEYLPICEQAKDPISPKTSSPGESLVGILDYIRIHHQITLDDRGKVYRGLQESMLISRILVNLINKKFDSHVFDYYYTRLKNMIHLETKESFDRILFEVFEHLELDSDWSNNTTRHFSFKCYLGVLNSLLLTDIPWCELAFQISPVSFDKIKGLLEKLKSKADQVNAMQNKYSIEMISELDEIIAYIEPTINRIEEGIRWQGMKSFSLSSVPTKYADNFVFLTSKPSFFITDSATSPRSLYPASEVDFVIDMKEDFADSITHNQDRLNDEYDDLVINTLLSDHFEKLSDTPKNENMIIHNLTLLQPVQHQEHTQLLQLDAVLCDIMQKVNMAEKYQKTHIIPCNMGRHFFITVLSINNNQFTAWYITSVKNEFDTDVIKQLHCHLCSTINTYSKDQLNILRLNQQTEITNKCGGITVQNIVDIATGKVKLSADLSVIRDSFSIRTPSNADRFITEQLNIINPTLSPDFN